MPTHAAREVTSSDKPLIMCHNCVSEKPVSLCVKLDIKKGIMLQLANVVSKAKQHVTLAAGL